MTLYDPPDREPDYELIAQVRWERQRNAHRIAHPDPRDPDYPGDPDDED